MKRLIPLLLLCVLRASAQTATITWGTTAQVIDGFGVSNYTNQGNTNVMNSYDNTLFNSIGISLLRVGVTSANGACTSVNATCGQGSGSDPGSSNIVDAQYCVNSSFDHLCRVWATPWSPPASYSSNGNTNCQESDGTNDNSFLTTSDYAAYATWLSNFVTSYNTYNSVQLYAISVQNEPDQCKQYPSNLFGAGGTASGSASAFDNFIKTNFGPTMHSANPNTLIMMPEPSGNDILTSYAGTCMSDSSCSQYIGIAATHAYDWPGHSGTSNPYSSATTHYWESEYSENTTPFDGSMTDAIAVAKMIDTEIATNGFTSYHWYWGVCPTYSSGPSNTNSCLISASGSVAQRAYVMGQYAKFVRPGMVRIGTTRSGLASGITVSAYKNSSTGAFAIVATNSSSGSVSQAFSFSGITVNSITTTVQTDASESMATISNPTVSGSAFTATLPANSVTTFSGTAASSAPTYYVSQTGASPFSGGPTGSVCNGKTTAQGLISAATFSSTTYNTAGTTIYLCGVITSLVTYRGSGAGSSGVATTPNNIIWDVGAQITWALGTIGVTGSTVGFNIFGNYNVFNGGIPCNRSTACFTLEQANPTGWVSGMTGIVQVTGSGSAYANNYGTGGTQTAPYTEFQGIYDENSNTGNVFKNLIIRNLYVKSNFNDAAYGGGGAIIAIQSNGQYESIFDTDCHDTSSCFGGNTQISNWFVQRNYMGHYNWGVSQGSSGTNTNGPLYISDNYFDDTYVWDGVGDHAHHDQIVLYGDTSDEGYFIAYIWNNHFSGCGGLSTNPENNTTASIYMTGGYQTYWIYNNNFASPQPGQSCYAWNDGILLNTPLVNSTVTTNNIHIVNNTMSGFSGSFGGGPGTVGGGGQCGHVSGQPLTFVNNIAQKCYVLVDAQSDHGQIVIAQEDYNAYALSTGTASYTFQLGTYYQTLANWGTALASVTTGGATGETHSIYVQSGLGLNSNGQPTSSSPSLPGLNLSSDCTGVLTPLCSDTSDGFTRTPTARGSSWTIGAFQTSGASSPSFTVVPTSLAFGSVNVGFTSSAQTITITNSGTASGSLGTPFATLSNSDYSVTGSGGTPCTNGGTLAVGASCTASVTVTPSVNGTDNGTLTVNGSGSPTVALTATGVGGVSALAPTSLTFGSQVIGTTSPSQTFTLTNNGPGLLTITAITKSGDFNQTNTCVLGSAMAVSASCTFTVTFTPTLSGTRTGSVTITDNGSNSPEVENLTGTGLGSNPSTAFWNGHIRYEGTVTW